MTIKKVVDLLEEFKLNASLNGKSELESKVIISPLCTQNILRTCFSICEMNYQDSELDCNGIEILHQIRLQVNWNSTQLVLAQVVLGFAVRFKKVAVSFRIPKSF